MKVAHYLGWGMTPKARVDQRRSQGELCPDSTARSIVISSRFHWAAALRSTFLTVTDSAELATNFVCSKHSLTGESHHRR